MSSNRSDVTKMLVARPSRPSSMVGGSSATRVHQQPVRGTAKLPAPTNSTEHLTGFPAVPQTKDKAPTTLKAQQGKSSVAVAGSNGEGSATGRKDGSGSANNATGKSCGFMLMKCLEVLKKAKAPMHIQELQVALGQDHVVINDREFLNLLRSNPRVAFDPNTKKWSHKSPYQFLVSADSILKALKEKPELINGFDVTQEALQHHPDVVTWIDSLLVSRAVRAVRANRSSRCKVYSTESGLYCDLYRIHERCEACASHKGVVLYPLGADHFENFELDSDLKELWHKIPNAPINEIQQANAGKTKRKSDGLNENRLKRRKPAGSRAVRVQRIANAHIYTADEFKEALTEAVGAEGR